MYENEMKKSESNTINFVKDDKDKNIPDVTNIDSTKLSQAVLEQGIYEHLPYSVIYSKSLSKFIKGFMKYSFAIGRNANMTPSQFEKICDGVDVSINLFSEVGNGYFEDIILPYKGSLASFQIDASKINDREILVFVLSVKSRDLEPDLFDIKQDFEGDLNAYREVVKEKVLKAKDNGILIVGLTTGTFA